MNLFIKLICTLENILSSKNLAKTIVLLFFNKLTIAEYYICKDQSEKNQKYENKKYIHKKSQ